MPWPPLHPEAPACDCRLPTPILPQLHDHLRIRAKAKHERLYDAMGPLFVLSNDLTGRLSRREGCGRRCSWRPDRGRPRVAARGAEKLRAGRVFVLVPSLDLLAQTEAAWREARRTGPMIEVSSLRGEDARLP